MRGISVAFGVLLMAGCGGGGSGGDSGVAGGGGGSVTLVGVALEPDGGTIGIGQSLNILLMGTFSDGSRNPVPATWVNSNPTAASFSGGVVTGLKAGTTLITGTSITNPTLFAFADITVKLAGVFAADRDDGLVLYPMNGGSRTVIPLVGDAPDVGMLAGIAWYAGKIYLSTIGSPNAVYEVDPSTGMSSMIIDLGGPPNLACLAIDSKGNLYTIQYGIPNRIRKYDLSTLTLTSTTDITGSWSASLDVDDADNVYTHELFGFPDYVKKMAPDGTVTAIAQHPGGGTTAPSGGGFAITSAGGVMFVTDVPANTVFRFEDGDGDGVYETSTVAATLAYPFGILWYDHDDSILVNGAAGIRQLKDLDGDGVFEQETLWSPDSIDQGFTATVMVFVKP